MAWHYVENGQQTGPYDDTAFNTLVAQGRVTPATLVWREGMKDWRPYASVLAGFNPNMCAECGQTFTPEDLVQIGNTLVCATCKPMAVQKLREGIVAPGELRFAGFWIRFAAKIVDWLILWVVMMVLQFATGAFRTRSFALIMALNVISILLRSAYSIYFHGSRGATPGKLACGIHVVRADGSPIGYALATGRFFAEMLSFITFGIGYIMAGFDDQKRSLHDRICETRVVYK